MRWMLVLCFALPWTSLSAFTLPALFSDGMVLQQQDTVEVWGWGSPRETIQLTASWRSGILQTVVDNQGNWKLSLPTPTAGGPYTIILAGANRDTLENVLIGEVWLCSGQSNMEWSAVNGFQNSETEVAAAEYPNIRLFTVGKRSAEYPQLDVAGDWRPCSPESMRSFSAVAYFFARRLQAELGVPVGLINASWGGTPAEIWTPAPVIEEDPTLNAAATLIGPRPWGPHQPGRAWNGMIYPLTRFRIAGTIWYQGESNVPNADTYQHLFETMIQTWRKEWKDEFPFYWAQIAPYRYHADMGVRIRDAQRRTLRLPATGMAVTSDIGDTTDIHPANKQDVGLRLANLALRHCYEEIESVVSGPLYDHYEVGETEIVIHFRHAAGLFAKGGAPSHFEIAGPDQIFHPARARIEGDRIVVDAANEPRPVAVRFAWRNKATPNLFNGVGLPASSFRTDSW